jgi:hypothetical protein
MSYRTFMTNPDDSRSDQALAEQEARDVLLDVDPSFDNPNYDSFGMNSKKTALQKTPSSKGHSQGKGTRDSFLSKKSKGESGDLFTSWQKKTGPATMPKKR